MPRRKEPTYNDYARQIESLQAKMAERRERMVQVLSSVLDDKAAAALGDLSDTELQKVMELIVEDISVYVDRVIANRRQRSAPKAKTVPMPESVPKPAEKPAQAATKPPVNAQPVPSPRQAKQSDQTAVESANTRPNSGAAQPSKVPDKPLIHGEVREHVEGVCGIWDKDSEEWYARYVEAGMDFEIRARFLRQWFRTRSEVCTEGERKGKIIFPITANGGKRVEVDCCPGLLVRSIVPGNSLLREGN